ncbi:hypothetical protein Lal_00040350 [Lupinus albus]|uniref:Uncharacterized protein n=1 Tax=Lupinus albus TaxID=3870 RepID=A0A6A4R1U8_LUPAL|nr:hypothetical protein Lalb_Chr02g0159041 [Lupinus albus]KAF1877633.1 hypothetical protein Lal_00040350 [Lupinus albus]
MEEEVMQEVMDENMIVIIDENKEKMKESLERKMVENGEVDKEKRNELEETMMENFEGKIVIIDDGVDMEALLGDSEGNGYNGEMVRNLMEVHNEDIFSIDNNGEGDDQFPSWNQWKFEEEQKWYSSYLYWENENSDLNFWDVESTTNDWVVSLWQL